MRLGEFLLNLLLLTITFHRTAQTTCTSGCLSCEKIGFEDPKCTMCDSTKNYIMVNGKCVHSEVHGCTLLTFFGQCLSCEKYHYLDRISGDCKQVPQSNVISNCEYYQNLNICAVCEAEHYLDSDLGCLPVLNAIEHCEYYLNETKCMRCKENFWISYEQELCLPIDGDNCLIANPLRCGYCENNYVQSQNYAVTNLSQSHAQILMASYLSFASTPQLPIQQASCVRQSDENCEEFIDATTCSKCKSGYFLYDQDKRCYKKPVVSIPNCKYYLTLTTCRECESGFFKESPSTCTKNEVLPFCIEYENDKNTTFCKLCESE